MNVRAPRRLALPASDRPRTVRPASPWRLLGACAAALAMTASAQAAELYLGAGAPGLMLGVAQPMSSAWGLRADVSTIGNRSYDGVHNGIDFTGQAKLLRTGLFADWFVVGGSFRLTGGLTFNDAKIDLTAMGDGKPIHIGNTDYPTTTADRFDAHVRFPRTTPYLGLGWGHQLSAAGGVRLSFDLGASIGRATVTTTTQGPNLSLVSQSDIDQQTQELRDGVGKVRALPQLSFTLGYSF